LRELKGREEHCRGAGAGVKHAGKALLRGAEVECSKGGHGLGSVFASARGCGNSAVIATG
jgi:hypothetical protein